MSGWGVKGRPPHRKRWENMVERCYSPKHKDYENYGGRSIRVCRDWSRDWRIFQAWCMQTYQRGKTLDRIDNDGSYGPTNCCWSTAREQASNRRQVSGQKQASRVLAVKAAYAKKYGNPHTRTKKYCSVCDSWHPVSFFHRASNNSDGLQTQCKRCANASRN